MSDGGSIYSLRAMWTTGDLARELTELSGGRDRWDAQRVRRTLVAGGVRLRRRGRRWLRVSLADLRRAMPDLAESMEQLAQAHRMRAVVSSVSLPGDDPPESEE